MLHSYLLYVCVYHFMMKKYFCFTFSLIFFSIVWRKTPIWRETRRSSSRGTFRTRPPFTSNKPTNFSIQKKLLKNWLQTNSARYSQKLTRGRQIIRPQKDRVQPWTPTQVILKRTTPIFMGQTNTRSKAKVSREVSPHFSPILELFWFVVFLCPFLFEYML